MEAEIAPISDSMKLNCDSGGAAWVSPSVFPRGPLLVPRKPKKSHVFPKLVVQHHGQAAARRAFAAARTMQQQRRRACYSAVTHWQITTGFINITEYST